MNLFNAVMKTSFSCCKDLLTHKGSFITVDWPILTALWTSILSSREEVLGIANRIEDLSFLRELIEAAKIKSVIDKCYQLEQTAEAIHMLRKVIKGEM